MLWINSKISFIKKTNRSKTGWSVATAWPALWKLLETGGKNRKVKLVLRKIQRFDAHAFGAFC